MNKKSKKELEKKIVVTLDQLLSCQDKFAALQIKKTITKAGKAISKKFTKEVKKAMKDKPGSFKSVSADNVDPNSSQVS